MDYRHTWLLLAALYACGGERTPTLYDAVPVSAPSAPPGGELRWARHEGLEVRGWPVDEGFVKEVDARLASLELPPMRLVEPSPTGIALANRLAIVAALFHLVEARVEILPNPGAAQPASERDGLVIITGHVVTDAEERAMRDALDKTRGLRIVTELKLANPLVNSDLGHLDVGSDYSQEKRREVFKSSVVKRVDAKAGNAGTDGQDGQIVATDGVGRIAPGLYELADGTFARIHRGHRTIINPEGPAIVFEGRRYRLGWGSDRVVGPGDEGALVVPSGGTRAPSGELERSIARLVIGADFAATSAEGHVRLMKQKKPVHFLIDFDGTIYQTLDLAEVMPGQPVEELRIALNNSLGLEGAAYPAEHPRRVEMLAHERDGPEFAVINDELIHPYGYTRKQRASLDALTRRLLELFPRLGAGFVWDPRAVHPFKLAEHVEVAPDGILLASQLDPARRDPGPGFDVRGLVIDLSLHDEPIPPGFDALAMARKILNDLLELEVGRAPLWADKRARLTRLRGFFHANVFTDRYPLPWYSQQETFDVEVRVLLRQLEVRPGDKVLEVRRATPRELASGPVEGFPPDFIRVAETLEPDTEWYAWRLGDPNRPDEARWGHGLVRVEGEWLLVPQPWVGLE